jgi:AraC-like DNA-binding protein
MSDLVLPTSMPVAVLPDGIPTVTPRRHGEYVWPAGQPPVLLLADDFDLLWVTRGVLGMELEDGQKLLAREGEMLLLPPLVSGRVSKESERLTFWFCHFDFRASVKRAAAGAVTVPLKLAKGKCARVRAAYGRLNEIVGDEGHAAWRREAALIEMVAALAEAGTRADAGEVKETLRKHDRRVAMLRGRIEAEPTKAWRVSELAKSVGLSTGHLHALWAETLGCSIKGYIVRARLRAAMARLREGTKGERPAVKEVAAACGFSSQHLFCRQFRKAFGVTPSSFRDSAGL